MKILRVHRALKFDFLKANFLRILSLDFPPCYGAHLTGFSGNVDGGIASKDNSSKNRSQNVGIHRSLSNNTVSLDNDTRLTGLSDHLKGGININNTSTAANDSTVKPLKDKHDSNEEHSVLDCNDEQGFPLVDSQPNGAIIMGEGRNFQDGMKFMAQ